MSDNPYAPPTAELGGHGAAAAREGRGDFELGRALSEAWAGTWANFPLWLGAGLVWTLVATLASITVIGLLLLPVLAWGATLFVLRMHDGDAAFGDIFAGFSRFGAAFGPMFALLLALLGVNLLGSSVQILGAIREDLQLELIGYGISFVFGLLVMSRLTFAFFYVVDAGMPGVAALKQAWSVTGPLKWKVILLYLMSIPLMFVGLLLFVVGLIPATVVWYLMYVSAYRQIAGTRAAA